MPELPDVEVFRQYAEEHALNQKIRNVEYFDSRILKTSKKKITGSLEGQRFTKAKRRGKYLFLKSGDRWLVMHFGMTGHLEYFGNDDGKPEYAQLIIDFENKHNLAYISKRKLGKIDIAEDIDDFAGKHEIGIDVFDAGLEAFLDAMHGKRGNIKAALMDQSHVSGLGNIYADEVLYQEKIHPESKIQNLDDKQMKSIYSTIRRVLRTAIHHEADPDHLPRHYLLPHRSEGEKCPDCGGTIKKMTVNGRSTYFCPSCQTKS